MILEKLLNKLIEKWWEPRWLEKRMISYIKIYEKLHWSYLIYIDFWEHRSEYWSCWKYYSLNDLCSLDSWIRQFVCENNLYPFVEYEYEYNLYENYTTHNWWHHIWKGYHYDKPEYRSMLSSIQESKEKFLLSNIEL